MDDQLLGAVLERLDKERLASDAEELLLAACDSDEALDSALAGVRLARPERSAVPDPGAEPVGAYLSSITARAFRGIGTEATLQLQPGPGLTIVVGRNGSGKSSFAEALEVLLTERTDRFNRQAVFRTGWRNRHVADAPLVRAVLQVAGHAGNTVLERVWADDNFAASQATAQFPGERKGSMDALGWSTALQMYRPFLAHSELEVMFGTPSELHDRLSSVLGLEDLTATAKRLADRHKLLAGGVKTSEDTRKALVRELAELDDERASRCRAALTARNPDFDAAGREVTGVTEVAEDGVIARLRRLAGLVAVDPATAAEAAERLRLSADASEAVAGSDGARAAALADLLDAAVAHRGAHPDESSCPVCGTPGTLNEAWQQRAVQEVAQLRDEAATATAARNESRSAMRAALNLIGAPPPLLSEADGDDTVDTARHSALMAWQAWSEPPSTSDGGAGELRALADHLERHAAPLSDALVELVSAAGAAARGREDRWQPVAVRVAAWLEVGRAAAGTAPRTKALKTAGDWLKVAHDAIRNERLRPIADQAQGVWRMLRHDSNVDLKGMSLSGSTTNRRVDLTVEVDDVPGDALGVMSQGEVNALALSIFLPRATLPASPFRFVVIDDPVQAMDPAKVDGLARVLHAAAETRQVIVFTHDDRLPAAVRRLALPARILQVHRRKGSKVEITAAGDPATSALRDARAVANDSNVPDAIVAKVVPGMCRVALEAALTDIARRRLLGAGAAHADIEDTLAAAHRLTIKASLAFFGDADRGDGVLPRLNQLGRRHADTYQALNKGAHGELAGSGKATVRAAEELVEAVVGAFG